MARILFLAPTVTQPNLMRPFSFANMLAKKHHVEIIGPAKTGLNIFKSSKNFKVSKLESKTNIGKILESVRITKEFDVVVACDSRFYSSVAGLIAKIKGKRFIFDAGDDESAIIAHSIQHNPFVPNNYFKLIVSKINFFFRHFADEVTVASSFMKKKYGGIVFSVPVDVDFFSKNRKYNFTKKYGKNMILFAGVIQRYKGIDYLVEAFSEIKNKIKDAKLVFIGHTDLGSPHFAREIQERAGKLSKDILFLGNIDDPEKVRDFMKSAACLVLPTEDNIIHRMQTPIKLINYMASGTPIVATAVGDVPEILGKGKRGALVTPNDSSALANVIVNVLNKKAEYRTKAKGAFVFCKQNYSFDAVLKKLDGVYFGKKK